jgi:hypothetical protein
MESGRVVYRNPCGRGISAINDVDVSHSGHHDSLVRGIVICYTKSFQLLNLLFLLLAVSHSGHQDSVVRGIVICYTKSVATTHGGRVVSPPVARGSARC